MQLLNRREYEAQKKTLRIPLNRVPKSIFTTYGR